MSEIIDRGTMEVQITSPAGKRLFVKDKVIPKNIDVVPNLMNLSVAANGKYTPAEGYAGFNEVDVQVLGEESGTVVPLTAWANEEYTTAYTYQYDTIRIDANTVPDIITESDGSETPVLKLSSWLPETLSKGTIANLGIVMRTNFGAKPLCYPQPVFISASYDENNVPNAMNAAWGGQWDAKEIMISMGKHATTENLARCEEFTVAFATKDTMVASDFVGIVSAKNDPEKMQKTGWTSIKSENVNAPVFTDFPMTMECRILRKIDESEEGYYIVAEIVNILVDEKYLAEDGKPDVEKMGLITYEPIHHGYVELGKRVGNAFSDGKQLK